MSLFEGKPQRDSQSTHLHRTASVCFLKRVQKNVIPGSQTTESKGTNDPNLGPDRRDEFKAEYAEFLKEPRQLLHFAENFSLNDPTYDYYRISSSNLSKSKVSDSRASSSNLDVVSITVDFSTEGSSVANISLRNPNQKYQFVLNKLKEGHSLIAPMDMVLIYLPDLRGGLHRAFTGFISRVSDSQNFGNGIQNTISFECDGMMKLLKRSRTNVTPSMLRAEASRSIVAFQSRFAENTITDIVEEVLSETYCNFQSSLPFVIEALSARTRKASETQTSDILTILNNLRKAFRFAFIRTTGTIKAGYRLINDNVFQSGVDKLIRKSLSNQVISSHPLSSLAFVIQGSETFPFQKVTKLSNLFQSQWENSFNFIKNIAQLSFYEFFETPEGVIVFRPMNTLLPYDVMDKKYVSDDDKKLKPGPLYQLQKEVIIDESYSEDDGSIYTILYLQGMFHSAIKSTILQAFIVDSKLFEKFGVITAPAQTRVGLESQLLLEAYGVNILTRVNSRYRSGSITIAGDARFRIGNSLFVPHRNMVYYIERISHVYAAGGQYITKLTLSYGRSPIAYYAPMISKTADAYTKSKSHIKVIPAMFKDVNQKTVSFGASLPKVNTTLQDWYNKNIENKNLLFKGMIWEGIPTADIDTIKKQTDITPFVVAKTLTQDEQVKVPDVVILPKEVVKKVEAEEASFAGKPDSLSSTYVPFSFGAPR